MALNIKKYLKELVGWYYFKNLIIKLTNSIINELLEYLVVTIDLVFFARHKLICFTLDTRLDHHVIIIESTLVFDDISLIPIWMVL